MTETRIDPDKLLDLFAKREDGGTVTISWAMALQIIEQLRAAAPIAPAPPMVVTDEMVEAAADAHMPFGDMHTAIAAAQAVAPENEALKKERAERERFENLFSATCETLGRVNRELGMPDAAIGTEPEKAAVLRQERDALAAHACQVNEAWRVAYASLEECVLNEDSLGYWLDEHGYEELSEAFERHPATSLAHRDALMKTEALEALYNQSQGSGIITRGSLIDEARAYRRQAEGGIA